MICAATQHRTKGTVGGQKGPSSSSEIEENICEDIYSKISKDINSKELHVIQHLQHRTAHG